MSLQEALGSSYALVFPGQGSQSVGMAKALYESSKTARQTLDHVDDVLGFSLTSMMFEGPENELADTYNAQPAIFAASLAALRELQEACERDSFQLAPMAVAGHSLGEFSALVAAGSIDPDDGLRIVRARGQYMRDAGVTSPGGMAAVLGLDDSLIAGLVEQAAKRNVLTIANLNCPGQIVVSGEVEPLERFVELAKAHGARRVARLPISIASHSELMEPAATKLNALFDTIDIRDPAVPVIGNTDARPLTTAADVREELRYHVISGVNWTGTVQELDESEVTTLVEVGPGAVLTGLNRRIDPGMSSIGLKDLGLIPA